MLNSRYPSALQLTLLVILFYWTSNSAVYPDTLSSFKKTADVLPSQKFSGQVAKGYQAAQEAKEICRQLFCYCGCDLTDKHVSLLDCFTSMHGMDCAICVDEAIVANHMKKEGKSLAQIQKTIDDGFMPHYPWAEPSPALKIYLEQIKKYRSALDKDISTTYSAGKANGTKKKMLNTTAQNAGRCCQHKQ